MADLTRANFNYSLKILYPQGELQRLTYEASPAFALLPKSTDFVGDYKKNVLHYGGLPSISARFATAQTNRSHTRGGSMAVTRKKKYALAGIENEVVYASETNPGAVVAALKTEMSGALEGLGHALSGDLFATTAAGSIGVLNVTGACPLAGAVMQLDDEEDAYNFEVGMEIIWAANAASNPRDSGAALTVTAVDRNLGRITFDANLNTIAAIADGDLCFRDGDYTAANDENCINGYSEWIPATAPTTGDNFFGFDRSVDVVRCAGHRYTLTTHPGYSTEEAILLLASEIARLGGKPDLCHLGFTRFRGLVASIGSKVEYQKATVKTGEKQVAEVSFEAVRIHGPKGPIDVVPDAGCKEATLYVLSKNTWEFCSLGPAPRAILKGGEWARDSHDSDSQEIRVGIYGNLLCSAPGWNGRFDF